MQPPPGRLPTIGPDPLTVLLIGIVLTAAGLIFVLRQRRNRAAASGPGRCLVAGGTMGLALTTSASAATTRACAPALSPTSDLVAGALHWSGRPPVRGSFTELAPGSLSNATLRDDPLLAVTIPNQPHGHRAVNHS